MSLLTRIFPKLGVQRSTGFVWPSRTSTWNWWQFSNTRTTREFRDFAPVYACWRIIAEEVARVPLQHLRITSEGKEPVTNKAPMRVFRRPNRYQTRSDFMLYLTQSLLAEGNAYAYAMRNDRYEIVGLYPVNPRSVEVHIDQTDGSYYYHVSDPDALALGQPNAGYWFPSRDMLHIRLFTLDHPLVGITPLTAAAIGINAGMNINMQTSAFFGNMGRPSGIIKYPKPLDESSVTRIKERFMQATTGNNAGAPVVFHDGMDWQPLTMSAVDAELVESYKLSERQVAQIYRIPPFFLGDLEDAKLGSVEQLMRFFVNSGLGFYFTHIGEAFTRVFDLPANEEIEFDYESALLKSDFEARMKSLKEGIQGGVYSVNEARRKEGLPSVEHGDDVRMQQQMVPLSYGAGLQPDDAPPPVITESSRRLQMLRVKRQLRERIYG